MSDPSADLDPRQVIIAAAAQLAPMFIDVPVGRLADDQATKAIIKATEWAEAAWRQYQTSRGACRSSSDT